MKTLDLIRYISQHPEHSNIVIMDEDDMTPMQAPGFNTGSNERREKEFSGVTMFEFMRNNWNKPKSNHSPYKYFQGVLIPDRLDDDGNVVYKYNF
jgi:hypothetical protein